MSKFKANLRKTFQCSIARQRRSKINQLHGLICGSFWGFSIHSPSFWTFIDIFWWVERGCLHKISKWYLTKYLNSERCGLAWHFTSWCINHKIYSCLESLWWGFYVFMDLLNVKALKLESVREFTKELWHFLSFPQNDLEMSDVKDFWKLIKFLRFLQAD